MVFNECLIILLILDKILKDNFMYEYVDDLNAHTEYSFDNFVLVYINYDDIEEIDHLEELDDDFHNNLERFLDFLFDQN